MPIDSGHAPTISEFPTLPAEPGQAKPLMPAYSALPLTFRVGQWKRRFGFWLPLVALLAPLVCFVGCGGSNSGGGGTTPPVQLAAPTISPTTGTFTTAQTVTVTGAAGTSVHCTTDGSTPTESSLSCPSTSLSANGTTTFKAFVSESGNYTDSSVATATITISLPVPQSITLPATMAMLLNGSIDLNSSVVTASSSCAPSAVSWTVISTDSNTTTLGSSILASYSSSLTDWGTISAGNAVTENKVGTYNVKATCGTATATSLLTVTAGVPTVSSANPAVIKYTGGNTTFTGTNFSSNNSTTLTQWQGTMVASSYGPCPTTKPTLVSGSGWVSSTQINWGFTSTGAGLGSWNASVVNYPTAVGTDGGWTCLPNAYTITTSGNVSVGTGGMMASYDPETGLLRFIANNAVTVTVLIAKGGNNAVATADSLYVPQPAAQSVAKVDLQAKTVSYVPTPGYSPLEMATDLSGTVYSTAASAASPKQGAILRIANGTATEVSKGDTPTSISASNSRILWTSPSQDGASTEVHEYDPSSATEKVMTVGRNAAWVTALSDGKSALVYRGGDVEASVLDLDSFTEAGLVSFPAGILGASQGDRFSLLDGSVGSVKVGPSGTGAPQATWTLVSRQPVEDLYAGFAVTTANGMDMLVVSHRSVEGYLFPEMRPFTGANIGPQYKKGVGNAPSPRQRHDPSLRLRTSLGKTSD